MFNRKLDQLVENVIPLLGAGVLKGHPASHHLVGDPAEPAGDLNTKVARILALEPPSGGQDPEVFITFDQIICNHQGSRTAGCGWHVEPARRRGDRPGRSGTARGTTRPGRVIARALA